MNGADGSWRDVAAQKEQEWRDVLEQHVNSLEMALNNKQKELLEGNRRFESLKEDFQYNLKLISERDEELEKYDSLVARMKKSEATHDARVSDLLIALDQKKNEVEMEKRNHEDLKVYYQQRLKEKELEGEQWRLRKEAELKAERDDCDRLKRRLQQQISDLSVDLEAQRRELNVSFDEALVKKDRDCQQRLDEMHTEKLAAEGEVKQLKREVELLRINNQRTAGELESECGTRQEMERKIKELQWEVSDVTSMKDAKLGDMESNMQQLQRTLLKCQEERKSLDRIVKERESQVAALRESMQEREGELQAQITELESQIETCKIQQRQLQWAHRDAMMEKDKQIQKAQTSLSDCQQHLDSHRTESSRLTISRDLEMKRLLEEQKRVETELAKKNQVIDRYKRELAAGIERERDLEQSKVQLELQWDQKFRERQRSLAEQQDQLISSLCQARDEAFGKVQERELELQHRDDLINALTRERDQAREALHTQNVNHGNIQATSDAPRVADVQTHDITNGQPDVMASRLHELEDQNKKLRVVIRQMRESMESMGHLRQEGHMSQSERSVQSSAAGHYVEDVKMEMQKIRDENQRLGWQIEELERVNRDLLLRDDEISNRWNPEGPLMRAHVRAMNETIGALRAEKLEVLAESHRHQTKVSHLSSMLSKADEELRGKQVQLEHVQYEMVTGARRSSSEVAELRRRITELELSLEEVQRVADDYHKSSVEKNAEVTALRSQVSSMKLDVAASIEQGMSVKHAAVVAELEEEIERLRKQLSEGQTESVDGYNSVLRQKLKSASRRILELSRERQQLIDISNQLRAEMAKPRGVRTLQIEYRGPTGHRTARNVRNSEKAREQGERRRVPLHSSAAAAADRPLHGLVGRLDGKLDAVERLHYDLTRQELQSAQRGPPVSQTDRRHESSSRHHVKDLHVSPGPRSRDMLPASVLSESSEGLELEQQSVVPSNVAGQVRHVSEQFSSGSVDDANIPSLRDVWDTLAEAEKAVQSV